MPPRLSLQVKVSELLSSLKGDLLEIFDLLTYDKHADLHLIERRCRTCLEVLAANVAGELEHLKTHPKAFRIPISELAIYLSALGKIEALVEELLGMELMYEWPEKIMCLIDDIETHTQELNKLKS